MNGRAMIINGKLAISRNGSPWIVGIRFVRKQIAQIEASALPLKASTYLVLASYKAAVAFWDAHKA